jgi:acetoin utilization deacetylase AcuC-like enzyme
MVTAYVYDELYLQHDTGSHPENAGRLIAIMDALEQRGILSQLEQVEARDATEDELRAIHRAEYIEHVRRTAERGGAWLDGDTYVSPRSYAAATRAAGGLLALVDAIMSGEVDNGFALVRPPGHHAVAGRGMGFCLFNNVAIAAARALARHGLNRVLIVDYDVHHGNGTADSFYSDPRVLYFSTHQYPHYPGTGHWSEKGSGEGEGYTVNVPLPGGVGDEGYSRVFEELLAPIAERYDPELVLVSVGYDAHWRDPLAQMRLSTSGYWWLAGHLRELADRTCQGRVAFTLEGGYDLEALTFGVVATFDALRGQQCTDSLGSSRGAETSIVTLLEQVKAIHGIRQ